MSEQSLTSFEQQIPAFREIADADFGRVVNPDPTGEKQQEQGNVSHETSTTEAESPERTERDVLARDRGWVPKGEWKKNPDDWVDSDTFNQRWEQALPVVQKENKKLWEKLQAAERQIADLSARTQGFEKSRSDQEAAQRLIRGETLQMELRKAVEENDVDTQTRVHNELVKFQVEEELNKRGAAQLQNRQPQVDPAMRETLERFVTDNPVFRDDAEMAQVLTEQATVMRMAGNQLQGREFLDRAKERVARMYPEKFNGGYVPRRHPIGETGGAPTGGRSGPGRNWSDLKPEYRAALDKFIATTPGATRENLLKAAGPDAFRS